MLLVDFSQVYLAPIFVDLAAKSCAQNPSNESRDMMMHFVVNTIRAQHVMHKKNYGSEIVIAVDSTSWRKDVFPNYKFTRKVNREKDKSGIDWLFVFETQDYIVSKLQEFFPYAVIKVNKAEADDIIGSIVKYVSESSNSDENMFGDSEPEKILILSSDKDHYQLHRYNNVRQWSPLAKKLVKPDIKPEHALIEKIVLGDIGDSLMNIKTHDNFFAKHIKGVSRQASITKKYLQTFFDAKNPIDACLTEDERINYKRNEQLISYEFTPKEIHDDIISTYNNEKEKLKSHSKMNLMNFFMKNRMNVLLTKIHDFY